MTADDPIQIRVREDAKALLEDQAAERGTNYTGRVAEIAAHSLKAKRRLTPEAPAKVPSTVRDKDGVVAAAIEAAKARGESFADVLAYYAENDLP